jgi:hypothetical protein
MPELNFQVVGGTLGQRQSRLNAEGVGCVTKLLSRNRPCQAFSNPRPAKLRADRPAWFEEARLTAPNRCSRDST